MAKRVDYRFNYQPSFFTLPCIHTIAIEIVSYTKVGGYLSIPVFELSHMTSFPPWNFSR